ncbi:MAG: alanine racemase [Patescibacteria group bacterium]
MVSRIHISRQALLHNAKTIAAWVKPAKLMAVVKSNAYGHGASQVVSVLEQSDAVDWYGVIALSEALHLRSQGVTRPVLVLGYVAAEADQLSDAIQHHISLTVYNPADLAKLAHLAEQLQIKVHVHLKVETGLNRLGFSFQALPEILPLLQHPWVNVEGVSSHFASVEEQDMEHTNQQLKRFQQAIDWLAEHGIHPQEKHIASSAGACLLPQARYTMVRVGIALYGQYPSLANQASLHGQFQLQPILTWQAPVLHVKPVAVGEVVGYGCTYTVTQPTSIAVVGAGYADGVNRLLSNTGRMLLNGQTCPIIGRVSMNSCTLDVTHLSQPPQVGEFATLLGTQGGQTISAMEVADQLDTISYEVLTRLNWVIHRQVI